MSDSLLTTKEVAHLIGVGPTSVKRWADAGVLPCVKTAGGHRRFVRAQVDRFLESHGATEVEAADVAMNAESWIELLRTGPNAHAVNGRLMSERAHLGSWWKTAETLGEVVRTIGDRWMRGELRVLDEHIASESLHRAVTQCGDNIPVQTSARRCLLVTPVQESHTLGLSLVELCAREAGWNPCWAGPVPEEEAIEWCRRSIGDLVVASATAWMDPLVLTQFAQRVGEGCAQNDVDFLLGGSGNWPNPIAHGRRLHTFEELSRALNS